MTSNVTGRDGWIIAKALAFSIAAMEHLPQLFQPSSDMEDMRALLFAKCGRAHAERELGAALLLAWNLRADAVHAAGRDGEEFTTNLRRIREQVLAEPPVSNREGASSDTAILVRYIDEFLAADDRCETEVV